jgi:hypothetical protein
MEMATRMLALLLFKSFEITCSLTLRGFVVDGLGSNGGLGVVRGE